MMGGGGFCLLELKKAGAGLRRSSVLEEHEHPHGFKHPLVSSLGTWVSMRSFRSGASLGRFAEEAKVFSPYENVGAFPCWEQGGTSCMVFLLPQK